MYNRDDMLTYEYLETLKTVQLTTVLTPNSTHNRNRRVSLTITI